MFAFPMAGRTSAGPKYRTKQYVELGDTFCAFCTASCHCLYMSFLDLTDNISLLVLTGDTLYPQQWSLLFCLQQQQKIIPSKLTEIISNVKLYYCYCHVHLLLLLTHFSLIEPYKFHKHSK
jgi:hypothetical protein